MTFGQQMAAFPKNQPSSDLQLCYYLIISIYSSVKFVVKGPKIQSAWDLHRIDRPVKFGSNLRCGF